MVEPKSKTIDGKEILTVPFMGRRALAYKTKIIRLFGASGIGKILSQFNQVKPAPAKSKK